MNWEHVDLQMRKFRSKLMNDLGFDKATSSALATTFAQELKTLSEVQVRAIKESFGPVPIDLVFEEITAFQQWMELATEISDPVVKRAQVITTCYTCFLYLGDGCFRKLAKFMPKNTAVSRACRFLVSKPIKAFRNAFAHGKWHYQFTNELASIVYWDWDNLNSKTDVRWEVNDLELEFWEKLARSTAYVFYQTAVETFV